MAELVWVRARMQGAAKNYGQCLHKNFFKPKVLEAVEEIEKSPRSSRYIPRSTNFLIHKTGLTKPEPK